ncbi:MAG: hypothetical protein ACRCXZ_04990 [Patescibacteria group bacterium]
MNKKHWFKNKSFGIGWVPATIEGWFVMLGFTFTTILNFYLYYIGKYDQKISFFIFGITLITLLIITIIKGEKLKPNF